VFFGRESKKGSYTMTLENDEFDRKMKIFEIISKAPDNQPKPLEEFLRKEIYKALVQSYKLQEKSELLKTIPA